MRSLGSFTLPSLPRWKPEPLEGEREREKASGSTSDVGRRLGRWLQGTKRTFGGGGLMFFSLA